MADTMACGPPGMMADGRVRMPIRISHVKEGGTGEEMAGIGKQCNVNRSERVHTDTCQVTGYVTDTNPRIFFEMRWKYVYVLQAYKV